MSAAVYTTPRSTYRCSDCKQDLPAASFGPMRAKGHLRPVKYVCRGCCRLREARRWQTEKILNSLGNPPSGGN